MRLSIGFELETSQFAFVQVHQRVDKYYLRPFPAGTKYSVPDTNVEIYGDVSSEAVFRATFSDYQTCPFPIQLVGRSQSGENRQFIISQTFIHSVINNAEFVVTFANPTDVDNENLNYHVLDKYLDSLHLIHDILTSTSQVYELDNRPQTFRYKYLIFPTMINSSTEREKYAFLSTVPPNALVSRAHFTSQATVGINVRDVSLFLLSLKFWEMNPELAFFFNRLLEGNHCFNNLSPDRQVLVKQVFLLVMYSLNRGSHHRKNVSIILLRNSCQNLLQLLTDEERRMFVACIDSLSTDEHMKRVIHNDINLVLMMQRYDQDMSDRLSQEEQIARAFQERVINMFRDIVTRPLSRTLRNKRQFLTDVGLIQNTEDDRVFLEIRIFKDWLKKQLDLPRDMFMSIHPVMTAVDKYLVDHGYLLE